MQKLVSIVFDSRQHSTARDAPVDDRHEIHEAAGHRNDMSCPRTTPGSAGRSSARAAGRGRSGARPPGSLVRRLRTPSRGEPHDAHQALHLLAVDHDDRRRRSASTSCGATPQKRVTPGGQFVDPAHQSDVALRSPACAPVVHRRARHIQQLALPPDQRQPVVAVDHGPPHLGSKRASPRPPG